MPWLLLVPVTALLLIAPPALGSEVLAAGSAVRPAEGPAQRALPSLRAGKAPQLRLVDLVHRAPSRRRT